MKKATKGDNTVHLAAAAKRRSDMTSEKARDALRRLDRSGSTVSFAAVAQAAMVSRSWLYRQPDLRADIERLRQRRASVGPVAQRASDASLHQRIETLLEANKELRQENHDLRHQIADLLGEQRAARSGRRADRMIGPCQ